jgi:ABC-2 type transport system permease protein
VGLAYILIWEGMLTSFLTGTRVLSVTHYGVAVSEAIGDYDLVVGQVHLAVALILAPVITVGATVLAIDRLRSYRLAGETG